MVVAARAPYATKRERREDDRLRVRTCSFIFLDKLEKNHRIVTVKKLICVWVVFYGDARVVRTVQAAKTKNARRASMVSECVEASVPSTKPARRFILKIRMLSVSD